MTHRSKAGRTAGGLLRAAAGGSVCAISALSLALLGAPAPATASTGLAARHCPNGYRLIHSGRRHTRCVKVTPVNYSLSIQLDPATAQSDNSIGMDVSVRAHGTDDGIYIYQSKNGTCDSTKETASNNNGSTIVDSSVGNELSSRTSGSFHQTFSAPWVNASGQQFIICGLLYNSANNHGYAETQAILTVSPVPGS
jgi:hypothetical protein